MVHVLRYAKLVVVFVLLWVGIFVYNNYGCKGPDAKEMEPQLPGATSKLFDPTVRSPEQLQHDDLVLYSYTFPGKGFRTMAGRIVGLPGDRVKIEKGEVLRNGNKISSGYVAASNKIQDDYAEVLVPRDSVFILCDNRRNYAAFDSRALGPVGMWSLAGRFR
jgi:signal peptidase I